MEIDYRQNKARTTLEKREHWRKKQQLKDLREEHDKESKQRKFLKLEVRELERQSDGVSLRRDTPVRMTKDLSDLGFNHHQLHGR